MQQGHRGSNGTTLASPKQRQAPDRPGSGELRTFLTTGEETAGAFFMAGFLSHRVEVRRHPSTAGGGRIVSPPRKACSRFKWAGIQALHRPAILFIVPAESLIRSQHRRRLGEGRGLNHGGGP